MAEKGKTGKTARRQTRDRVLQTRIPEHLDEELRDRAEQLGTSVSTIVRNVLLHTFDLVEGVVTDSSQIARVLMERSPSKSPEATGADEPGDVIGWQEAILNKNGVCEQCNAILPAGERAAVGVPAGRRALLLCLDCLGTLSVEVEPPQKSAAAKRPSQRGSKRQPTKRRKPPA